MNLHSAVAALSLASWIPHATAQALAPTQPEPGTKLPVMTVAGERVGSF